MMAVRKKEVVLLAGGVGGAKIAEGLNVLDNVELSIIGNIGDDDTFHGLHVSPDIDTLIYSLSDLVSRSQGWGIKNDCYRALSLLKKLGNQTWMSLGDTDFGLHIYRTNRLKNGDRPSVIAADIAIALNIKAKLLLPSDDAVRTMVKTDVGWMSFQEYFVKEKCKLEVLELRYEGIEVAVPTPETINTLESAEIIIFAPSNPLLSIAPIIGIPGLKELISLLDIPKIGISPLIGGRAIKGPADKVMRSMGFKADALGVADFYKSILNVFFIDCKDIQLKHDISLLGLNVEVTDIVMNNSQDKKRLASEALEVAYQMARLKEII